MRNGTIDGLRGFGAIGIIWFHLALPGSEFALSALPMFVILLVFFGAGRSLRYHATRLLVPWIIWCVVYGALKLADAVASGTHPSSEFEIWMLATGPAIHLWFLPFCFLYLVSFGRLPNSLLLRVAIPLAALSLWVGNSVHLPAPFAQWCSVLAAALLGQLMAQAHRPQGWALIFAALGLAFMFAGLHSSSLQLTIAALMVAAAMWLPLKPSFWSSQFAALSLGIYLAHPAIHAIALRLGEFGPWEKMAAVAVASALTTMLLRLVLPVAVGAAGPSLLGRVVAGQMFGSIGRKGSLSRTA